jgi:heat shock protein HslJ
VARWLLPLVLLALFPATASAGPLAGRSWRVTRIGGVDVRSAHERLRFNTRHVFTGRGAGCGGRDFGGHYRATATRLRFKDVHLTGEGCDGTDTSPPPPSIGAAIAKTRSYRITGRTLRLLGRRGRTLAVLRRR